MNPNGYVYAVYSADKMLMKIGYSKEPEVRISALKYAWGTPLPLEIVGIVQSTEARIAERALHWKFENCREQGEWFRLQPIDLMGIMIESSINDLVSQFLELFPEQRKAESEPYKPSTLGKNIRYYRTIVRRLRQNQLAEFAQINVRYIGRIETGVTQTMYVEQAYAIAQALGVTVEDLMQEHLTHD